MPCTNTPLTRHHAYVCHLIHKLESRFGPDDEFIEPLRNTAALLRPNLTSATVARCPDHAEKAGDVIQRFWDSRKHRLEQV